MAQNVHPDPSQFDKGPLWRTPQEDWQFAGAQELRDWVEVLTRNLEQDEWPMQPASFTNLVVGSLARSTKTYQAALLLSDRGYGQQAAMLNRSLFEDMVVVWWMCLRSRGDDLVDAMKRHHDHARVLYNRACERYPDLNFEKADGDGALDPEYVALLDKEFTPYGGQWHGKKLHQLVRDVDDGWEQPYEDLLGKFMSIVNHWNNYLLHHSSVGLLQNVRWQDPARTPKLLMGPSNDWAPQSLWTAYWCYGLTVLCVLRELSPGRVEGYREFFEERANRFISISREAVRGIGRNDPCLCGSARKYKHCHEPYVR